MGWLFNEWLGWAQSDAVELFAVIAGGHPTFPCRMPRSNLW